MKNLHLLLVAMLSLCTSSLFSQTPDELKGKKIIFIERDQYLSDHHNTATMFQKGEINEASFVGGAAMKVYDVDTKQVTTLYELSEGIVRDPEVSYDGKTIIFSARQNKDDYYHIYQMNVDGTNIQQLTFAEGISDIDPLYLPNGDIIFSSTRQPKYCMCNRHIMANLFRMNADGSNITQIGVSTLFEGHSTMLPDGRVLYDRWEYVDRNFGDAQGLWTVNPDGTKHSVYYGNNTNSPGGVIDARHIPGTDMVACIFGSCHDRPWGALVILDRKQGVDGEAAVKHIFPAESRALIGVGDWDTFKKIDVFYEDPYPLNENLILVTRTKWTEKSKPTKLDDFKTCIYIVNPDKAEEQLLIESEKCVFDPVVIEAREKPNMIPDNRNYSDNTGTFYVQNVYEGTHMQGVEKGAAKYLRLVETPEKRTYTKDQWGGQGAQAPGINWHSFETKKILGEFPIDEDGSVHFEAPAGIHVFFQILDKDKKMIQSMRSGVSLMPGETNGCIGCHEDRLSVPPPTGTIPTAIKRPAQKLNGWMGKEAENFSFMKTVQPIFDAKCVSCHDFDVEDRAKLVLAKDMNPFFNAAYVNLHLNKYVNDIGGGPADIQAAYSWGTHTSKLTKIIDSAHKDVKLTDEEKEILYTWMDLNSVYYPVYDSSFWDTPAGRSPLTSEETAELSKLTGVNFAQLKGASRKLPAQVSFDRPELSPCLDAIRGDKEKYDRAVEILTEGYKRLLATPRGDIEEELVLCEQHKQQIAKYTERMKGENQNSWCIDVTQKRYDKR